ncbi:MAG: hypothetical protein N5P05_004368 (plasmid) [Chroococcopsis gigantea SAG 12.99]|jgi:hypothetical protein|nr:hypothetical protein [Chroococcopsis gigantea SAG 12.99]
MSNNCNYTTHNDQSKKAIATSPRNVDSSCEWNSQGQITGRLVAIIKSVSKVLTALTVSKPSTREKLARAASSLRAVRKYGEDKRKSGSERVHQYFDDIEGDWLEKFEDWSERPAGETYPANLSEEILREG